MPQSAVQSIRTYSTGPVGAARVEVLETSGAGVIRDNKMGTCGCVGILPRGPEDVFVPVPDSASFHLNFGDPKDSRWVLDRTGTHLTADWVAGWHYTSAGRGMLWVMRPGLGGRRASVTIKNRLGGDALRISGANAGRWAGQKNWIAETPVLVATKRTFTLHAPGVKKNEFMGGDALFSSVNGRRYRIIGNTEANEAGFVIFTVSPQYSLLQDGISGPTAIAGRADYRSFRPITGTASYAAQVNMAGTAQINGQVVTGTGTMFMRELRVGDNIYFEGEARSVESISSDTTLTIEEAFTTTTATDVTLSRNNLTLVGSGTSFNAEVTPGMRLYVNIETPERTLRQVRTVRSIESNTSLTLESGFTQGFTNSVVEYPNLIVTGVGTSFTADVRPGQFILDPNRAGSVKVMRVISATQLEVERQFSANFTGAQLTTQNQKASIVLEPGAGEGIFVEIGQGTKFPLTHFSISIIFNGSRVLYEPDVSLDPEDSLYIEPVINDGVNNVAYRSGAKNYQRWITVENLWTGAYTTAPGDDVRPCNGAGQVLEVTTNRAYTDAAFDYAAAVGRNFYPDPYGLPRAYFRIERAKAPLILEGHVSTTGVRVIGTATNFRSTLAPGDYVVANGEARKVRLVESDVSVILESRFTRDLPPLTSLTRAGYLEVGRGYNLSQSISSGGFFLVSYEEGLSQGYDGDTTSINPWTYLKHLDTEDSSLIRETFGRQQGLIRLAIPGVDAVSVKKGMCAWAEAYAHEAIIEIPANFGTAVAAEAYINQEVGRSDFASACFPSYAFVSSPYGAGDRLVPLTGDWHGGQSRYAVDSEGYHMIFAGNNAAMRRINRLPVNISPKDEAILNSAGIVPIKTVQGNIVPYGANSLAVSDVFRLLTTARIQRNIIHVFLEAPSIQELLFQPNSPALAQMLRLVIDGYARKEYNKGVFTNEVSYEDAVKITILEGRGTSAGQIEFDRVRDVLVDIVNGQRIATLEFIPTGPLQVLKVYCGPNLLTANFGASVNQASI
jgi:hypothetical protein